MSSSPLILLCPGQGAQFVGMGKAWHDASPEARALFDEADAVLGARLGGTLSDLCFSGPAERLNRTDVSQPAIFVTSVACWRGLLAGWSFGNGEAKLAAAAGLSLGEYTALHLAGAISFRDALELVTLRGRAMQDAAEAVAAGGGGGSGMVALIGADEAQAEAVCAQARGTEVLVPANFNAPGQIVLSGHLTACQRAGEAAGGMGLRATMLHVAGAFHSPLMAPAAERLRQALARIEIKEPRCPVLSNVTGTAHAAAPGGSMSESIRARLVDQLTMPVRWAACCTWLGGHAQGAAHELAPGKTLAGLMRRIDRDLKVTTHDEPEKPHA